MLFRSNHDSYFIIKKLPQKTMSFSAADAANALPDSGIRVVLDQVCRFDAAKGTELGIIRQIQIDVLLAIRVCAIVMRLFRLAGRALPGCCCMISQTAFLTFKHKAHSSFDDAQLHVKLAQNQYSTPSSDK